MKTKQNPKTEQFKNLEIFREIKRSKPPVKTHNDQGKNN